MVKVEADALGSRRYSITKLRFDCAFAFRVESDAVGETADEAAGGWREEEEAGGPPRAALVDDVLGCAVGPFGVMEEGEGFTVDVFP